MHQMPDVDLEIRRVIDVAGTILSPGEAERASRFRLEEPRRRFVAARTLLRQLVAGRLGIDPDAVLLEADEKGKPFVAGRPFELNLSHSGDYIAVAFSLGPVGIDIERINEHTPIAAIARRFFQPAEVAYLDSLPASSHRQEFFRLWTIKEAAIKGDGTGVWRSITTVTIEDPRPSDLAICHVNGKAWEVRRVEVAEGYWGSVAVAGGVDGRRVTVDREMGPR